MNSINMHWVNRLAVLGLVIGLTAGFAAAGVAQSVSARAYGAYANTPLGSVSQSPLAVLPYTSGTDGNMAHAESDGLSAGSALSADFLNSITSGAIGTGGDPSAAGAQSVASLGRVDVLSGLITADGVIASVASTRTASGAVSDANGSSFDNLMVNGVSVPSVVAPNTRMDLPGVGYVILNEQRRAGDGVTSSGITVNMIHVVQQTVIPGTCTLLGCTPDVTETTGEIIVGSASSAVR